MQRIYLDNAATTVLDTKVLEAMMPYLTTHFGNPSSIYSYGRECRLAIENARKTVATILHAHPSEIFFTSGGTESINTAITAAVRDLHCKHIITSPIEHHATLHTVDFLHHTHEAQLSYVKVLPNGDIDLNDLEKLLQQSKQKCLVTLLHANNEIGNMTDIDIIGALCKKYDAVFHSDTVQTIGHYPIDLSSTPAQFISASAHKFHGPKGTGIVYVNKYINIKPFVRGGSQERNMRAGTENVAGIVGLAKALELASDNMEKDSTYILSLKQYMIESLQQNIAGISFNGSLTANSLYTVLSVNFPKTDKSEMILYNLDINNICASGGSACSSGASIKSHVIEAISKDHNKVTVRFSFSKHNTKEEIDIVTNQLKSLI